MESIFTTRRNSDYVTIVHLSDLHILPDGCSPRFKQNPDSKDNWSRLIKDISNQKPDIICVTGDLIDNPYSEYLKQAVDIKNYFEILKGIISGNQKEKEFNNWQHSVKKSFEDVLILLETICKSSNLDPDSSLFVVPGNHDYRVQGFINESALPALNKGLDSDEESRAIFKEVFKKNFRNKRIVFKPEIETNVKQDSIILAIAGFDSLAVDRVANFATGAISLDEYKKFDFFSQASNTPGLHGFVEFRIALVHHHPLPVVSTEYFREDNSSNQKKDDKGIIENLTDIFQAEPGTIFKNAGTFLLGALNAKVDLILHGHQHHSWFTQVRYPGDNDDEHKLLVAGAASIGEMTNGACKYNLIRLYQNGNITVEERSRQANPPLYTGSNKVKLHTDSELRIARINQARNNLNNKYIDGYPDELIYNIARAELVLRQTEVRHDGSAMYKAKFVNLHATDKNKIVDKLVIASLYSHGVYTSKPTVEVIGNHYSVDIEKISSNNDGSYLWAIKFTPNLSNSRPITLTIKYIMFNAFDFVEEYRLARTGNQEFEQEGYQAKLIIPNRLVKTISFPEGWTPPVDPTFSVTNENEIPDDHETLYHLNSLEYLKTKGVVTIAIDRPIPGYCYNINWKLDKIQDYEKRYYDRSLINYSRKIKSDVSKKKVNECNSILKGLVSSCGSDFFENDTELSLFIVVKNKIKVENRDAIDLVLKRIAFHGPNSSPTVHIKDLTMGSGLIGLAYRSGKTQTVSNLDDDEMFGYRYDDTMCKTIHATQWCFPLHIPASDETNKTRSPVYAILSIGSFKADGSLFIDAAGKSNVETDAYKNSSFGKFEKYVKSDINKIIYEALLRK